MRRIALIALATLFAATGAATTATAALSDRDAPVWRMQHEVLVAGRGGDHGGRNDGSRSDSARGRDAGRDKKGDVIWRIRDGKHRPFWIFRHDRGPDCFIQKVKVRDASGNIVTKSVHLCE